MPEATDAAQATPAAHNWIRARVSGTARRRRLAGSAAATVEWRHGRCSRDGADRAHRCVAAANAMPALRLRRLPSLRRRDRARQRQHQPMPSRRRGHHSGAREAARYTAAAARSSTRRSRTAPRCKHRRGRVHRVHLVHRRLSGRRDRRRGKAHAYRTCRPLHRLRALRAALPGRLHRARALGAPVEALRRRTRARSFRRAAREARGQSGNHPQQSRDRGYGLAVRTARRGRRGSSPRSRAASGESRASRVGSRPECAAAPRCWR